MRAVLRNVQSGSEAVGLIKEFSLCSYKDQCLHVEYTLPDNLAGLDVEFGLSPDYLNLLRRGRSILSPYEWNGARGWCTDSVAVWVMPVQCVEPRWVEPYQSEFGHGCALRLAMAGRCFGVAIGTEHIGTTSATEVESVVTVEL